MTDVEVKTEEEVFDSLLPVASSELPDDARATLLVLRELMYPVGFISNMDFSNMVEDHKGDYRESLVKEAHLVVADRP